MLKKILKILSFLMKFALNLWLFVLFSMEIFMLIVTEEISLQIILFIIISFILLCYSTYIFFFCKKKAAIVLYVSFLFLYIILARTLPDIKKHYDVDICLDSGICSEGIEVNTEKGKILVNKENCNKYKYEWNEIKKYCNTNKKRG